MSLPNTSLFNKAIPRVAQYLEEYGRGEHPPHFKKMPVLYKSIPLFSHLWDKEQHLNAVTYRMMVHGYGKPYKST